MVEDDDDRDGSGEEDLISGLPDELLHGILVGLRCARAAARTSVLSRRWHRVWAHLPELHLDEPAVSSPDPVDGALAGYLAPSLDRLSISLPYHHALAGRATPWLRFAVERVAGELRIHVPGPRFRLMEAVVPMGAEAAEIELLPACGSRARRVTLFLRVEWHLRLRPAKPFSALTALTIRGASVEGGELSNLVSTQCPRLSCLDLFATLVAASNVTIRSDSLHSLELFDVLNTQRLELVAPRLEKMVVSYLIQAHISAPKLTQLVWRGTGYDPDVGRRLGLLEVGDLVSASLMQRFDEVDVLKLGFCIPQGMAGYQRFLDATKRLPKCKTLSISLSWNDHGLAPVVLHLLRSCNGTRKLQLNYYNDSLRTCPPSCPCRLDESHKIDDINLNSLNKIEIDSYEDFHDGLEFVELMFRCNAKVQKLVINYKASSTPGTKVCEKVRNMGWPKVKVKFYVFPDGPNGRRVGFE
ncbi:hypothetical protein HU200_039821 [Digitaria exilis]|uniref:F-box/LRR-repeat protein 15/At3g58940/PEG3-like LRR domain-containing protein n=1 Tax=Digitaria exilis TaxID=1010633 RepID=A0A835EI27_9POAL|nr:hypothetical protein HU200_039821 [Digitaria exilis]